MTRATKIRALIVDDEPLARRHIRRLLERSADVEVLADCADGREAIGAIKELSPDLVFLDVQMPEADGFAVFDAVGAESMPLVVFVTAYDQYALQAFEVSALDYLLKPFDRKRFARSLERARSRLSSDRSEINRRALEILEELRAKAGQPERILIKSGGRAFFLKVDEIDWIEAEGKYLRLHVGRDSYLLREAISSVEAQLDPKKFPRIHRSTIVNIERVRELQALFNNEYHVVLHDGTELTLSHGYRKKLGDLLKGVL